MKREKFIDYWGGKRLSQLLALFVAIALTPSMLLADPDDPILNRNFFLIVFHKGGTLTQNTQGESGFDPSAVPQGTDSENNVISSPSSGVWQKTGWNTFAGTLLDIEYHNAFNPALDLPPNVLLFQFTKEQITGRLTDSGDQMVLTEVRFTHFDSDGKRFRGIESFPANGVRIPLEILPNSAQTLPVPTPPPPPAP